MSMWTTHIITYFLSLQNAHTQTFVFAHVHSLRLNTNLPHLFDAYSFYITKEQIYFILYTTAVASYSAESLRLSYNTQSIDVQPDLYILLYLTFIHTTLIMPSIVDENLSKLGITLPTAAAPAANYVSYNYSCGHIYISGQLPKDIEGHMPVGQLGKNVSVEEGQKAARVCGINIIAQIKAAVGGDFDRVRKIVKITCFVNSTADFTQHPAVANGCSDLLVGVFGDRGRHARCAVGVAQLPMGVPVEIDAQVEIEGSA